MKGIAYLRIKAHLLYGRSLTKLECIRLFNYINLGDVIYKLRKNGLPVDMKWGHSDNKRYAIYFIPEEYLKDLRNDYKTNQAKEKKVQG